MLHGPPASRLPYDMKKLSKGGRADAAAYQDFSEILEN